MRIIAAIAILLSPLTHAASWYVDADAAGANNGTSWTDAWTALTNVVWGASGVKAGDTLYISGGSESKSYGTQVLTAGASGTTGSPITIKVGQDAGHNGLAQFGAVSVNTRTNIIVDGSRSPSFTPPTSVADIRSITNNIGLKTARDTGTGTFVTDARNLTFRWIEVGNHGVTNVPPTTTIHGWTFASLTYLENVVAEYCWFHDIRNDAININSVVNQPTGYDALVIRWCLFERTGDDTIQSVRNGTTIANCVFRSHNRPLYEGHPDHIQFSGLSKRFFKFVNNYVDADKGNSSIIGEFHIDEGGINGDMLIAGNIFAMPRDGYWVDPSKINAEYGVTLDLWRPNRSAELPTASNVLNGGWSNVFVLHNTFYYIKKYPFKFGRITPQEDGSRYPVLGTDKSETKSAFIATATDSQFRNNLLVDTGWAAPSSPQFVIQAGGGDGGGPGDTNGFYYATNEVVATHNIVAGPNRLMSYHLQQSVAANAIPGNSTNMPLVETNLYTLVLSASDTVAKDQGFDISALTNTYPELMVDLYGTRRGQFGAWDIGAVETPDTGLVLHYDFSDSFDDAQITDLGGGDNPGLRFGHESTPTNWPTRVSWTHPVSGASGYAASFQGDTNSGWGLYNKSGDYTGTTNITGLQSLTNMTVAFWVKRYKAPDYDGDGLVEWFEDQSRYISGGFGYRGAWTVGMFSENGVPRSVFRTYTNDSALSDVYVSFGSATGNATAVVTSGNVNEGYLNWVHLGFSWDGSINEIKTFTNGVLATTASLPTVTNMTLRGPSGSLTSGWIALGVDTHNGKPWLTTVAQPSGDDSGDQYPNHAWFSGELADVRIYNRTLTTNEIWQIYSGTETGGGGGGGDPDPPASGPLRIMAGRLNVGRIE